MSRTRYLDKFAQKKAENRHVPNKYSMEAVLTRQPSRKLIYFVVDLINFDVKNDVLSEEFGSVSEYTAN